MSNNACSKTVSGVMRSSRRLAIGARSQTSSTLRLSNPCVPYLCVEYSAGAALTLI